MSAARGERFAIDQEHRSCKPVVVEDTTPRQRAATEALRGRDLSAAHVCLRLGSTRGGVVCDGPEARRESSDAAPRRSCRAHARASAQRVVAHGRPRPSREAIHRSLPRCPSRRRCPGHWTSARVFRARLAHPAPMRGATLSATDAARQLQAPGCDAARRPGLAWDTKSSDT